MISRSVPEAEKKLMILYTLARLGPCAGEQLVQFMAEYGLMDYITMQLTLGELEELGQVRRRAHPFGEMTEVTEIGAFTAAEFDRRIPASFRGTVDAAAQAWRERFYLERQTPAEVERTENGTSVHLQLLQNDRLLMEVRMPVPMGDRATRYLQRRWRETAYDARQLVLHLLGGDCPAEPPALPEGTELEERGPGDLLEHLHCMAGDMTLAVENPGLAAWYAHRWALMGPDVLKAVLELLHLSLQQEE